MQRLLQTVARISRTPLYHETSLLHATMPQQRGRLRMMSFSTNPLTSVTGGSLASSKACTPAVNDLYSFASQVMQSRHMSKLVPRFTGGKLRPYTSYRERFKTSGTGLILFRRPGHRHKRYSKGPKRNRQLRSTQVLTQAYTATMQRLGFVSRRF